MKSDTEITTFENGVQLATTAMPHMESVAVGFWTQIGSRHEDFDENGIAHFVEHLLFKGTPTRSAPEISRQIERLGATLDGFTVEDHTCYHVKGPSDHLEPLVEVLADLYRFPVFDPRDIEAERNVIFEEIAMIRDQPSQMLEDLLSEAAWGMEHPLGKPITGTEITLTGISRNELLRFFQRAYASQETVISVAGNIDHAKTAELIQERMGDLVRSEPFDFEIADPPMQGFAFEAREDLEQAQLAVGFRGCSRIDSDRYAMKMLNVLLGENMSSRLFQVLREELGLCYEVQSDIMAFEDAGLLHAYLALDPENVTAALDSIAGILKSFRSQAISESELEEAKSYLIGQSRIALENTAAQMMWAGESLLTFQEWTSPASVFDRIHEVTPEDVQQMAQRVFQPQNMVVAGIGPHSAGLELNRWDLVS
ncbi:MAG: insulinase family protein [Verrucomicrobiales bacterium]|nr:insulinase family protein [Verrucomicrobiales bacterium]